MSDDPRSPFYNRYLSRPFAVLANETLSAEEQQRLQEIVDREILHSGAGVRAFIDPVESGNLVVGIFAARVDANRKQLLPVASQHAITLFHPYLMGDNPPPPGGVVALPGTFGSISAHSGEFRTDATDLALPSPRMPIVIERTIGNQDTYEGPFGVGWDFNYGQRITELDPLSFPLGLQTPMVVRETRQASDIAGSQDVLFNTGMGRVLRFAWVSTNMPPEYQADPLVAELKYEEIVSDYYLPPEGQGIFDLLVKFKDGRFERLTPEGQRYRYSGSGRLELILDRFPKNRHELEYDRNGWLVRINDRSVQSPRYVEFGYYRMPGDPDLNAELDEITNNSYLEGKVQKLRDYAGRDVLYSYSPDGFLVLRQGVEVAGENGGFAGRNRTQYNYLNCKIVGVTSGGEGAPLFNADVIPGGGGKPVARSGTGASFVQFDIPPQNSAATVGGQTSTGTQANGPSTEVAFDSIGHPESIKVSGGEGEDSETATTLNTSGQLLLVRHPEGRVETYSYDDKNPIFRSRGNLISVTVDPGARGGAGYTETYRYDPRYNLPSGAHTDANGFTHTYTLQSDGRALTSIVRGDSGTETMSYNDKGQLLSSTDIRGVQNGMTYNDSTGFPSTARIGEHVTRFTYDGTVAARLGQSTTITPPAGAATDLGYNAVLQVVERSRAESLIRHAYDERGYEIFTSEVLGDGKVRVTRRIFDEKGFMTRSTSEGVEVDGTPTSLVYQYTPDALARVKSIEHPGGTLQTFEYDMRNFPIRMTLGNYVEEYRRDRHGNILEVREGGDLVMSAAIDGLDRLKDLVKFTGDAEETAAFTYFPGGQAATTIISDSRFGVAHERSIEIIDELGRPKKMTVRGSAISPFLEYEYRALEEKIIGPRMTIRTTWSDAGYPLALENPIKRISFKADSAGRPEEVESIEDGFTFKEVTTFNELDFPIVKSDLMGVLATYNPRFDGQNLSVINGRNHATTFEYTVFGEPKQSRRADGLQFRINRDNQRQLRYSGDDTSGLRFVYDGQFRLIQRLQRDGQPVTYQNFDSRDMPQSGTLPGGGEMTMEYDLQRRTTRKSVTLQDTTYECTYTYDSLGRIRVTTYKQDGSNENNAIRLFDPSGVLLETRFQEADAEFVVKYNYYEDGFRRSITYPSNVTIAEHRDVSGRLIGISDETGNILSASGWQGHEQVSEITFGDAIRQKNQFDARGRITASRFTRIADGKVIVHLRAQYDSADNLEGHQYLHRGGRTDFVTYDNGERISRARIGAIPLVSGGVDRVLYERSYEYEPTGLDYLVNAAVSGNAMAAPAFAKKWSGHDPFLLPTQVDSFSRGSGDPMGRVANAELQVREPESKGPIPQPARLVHNGRGELVRLERQDDVTIENFFQSNGLRFMRKITRDNKISDLRHYVYDDQGRLIEEYDRSTATPILLARYYYANGDSPVAADLKTSALSEVERYYFLRDGSESVLAIAGADGNVVERIWYDPFGQPVIEQRDVTPPVVARIMAGDEGTLLIVLSETVSSPFVDPGEGSGIVSVEPLDLGGAVRISQYSTNVHGRIELLSSYKDFAPYSVIEFTPEAPLADSASSLAAWWPGDQEVADIAGGNNGVLRDGAEVGPGINQQAFYLNGTFAYMEVPNTSVVNLGGEDFTLSMWVRFNHLEGVQVIAEKWEGRANSGWTFLKSADGRLKLLVGGGAAGEFTVESPPLALEARQWTQVAVQRQGSEFRLFTNGVPVAVDAFTADLSSSASFKIGSREGAEWYLNGAVDEVTLYRRALTEAELKAIAGGVAAIGPLTVTFTSGALADEWGNLNEAATFSFTAEGQPGMVYYGVEPVPETAAKRLARSTVGSPFLFHGQYFDYDSGLLYLRARFYDPFSGMFMEPDPLDYVDSVNLYVGFQNNPSSVRDPDGLSGRKWTSALFDMFSGASKSSKRAAQAGSPLPGIVGKQGDEILNESVEGVIKEANVSSARKAFQRQRFDRNEQLRLSEQGKFKQWKAKKDAPEYQITTFSGHGKMVRSQDFEVPRGTSVTFWNNPGDVMMDDIGKMIESGESVAKIKNHAALMKKSTTSYYLGLKNGTIAPPASTTLSQELARVGQAINGYDLKYFTYKPGDLIPEHILSKGTGLNIATGRRVQVSTPERLSSLLHPGMGQVHWCACRVIRW